MKYYTELLRASKIGIIRKADFIAGFDKIKKIKDRYDFLYWFRNWYGIYRQSHLWKNIKKKIVERGNGICEMCLNEMIDEIHHLTYKNIGNEKLEDLTGVCKLCHYECHLKAPESIADILKNQLY